MTTERTPWDDVQELAATIGHEAFFDLREVEHKPLVCEPWPHDDPEWPTADYRYMPDDMDEPTVCRVHDTEWWPCDTFTNHGGITHRPPTVESVFVVRPKESP